MDVDVFSYIFYRVNVLLSQFVKFVLLCYSVFLYVVFPASSVVDMLRYIFLTNGVQYTRDKWDPGLWDFC